MKKALILKSIYAMLIIACISVFSCKKANVCQKCIINIVDDSGNIVSIYTTSQFISVDPNGDGATYLINQKLQNLQMLQEIT